MQLSYLAVAVLFDRDVDETLAESLIDKLVFPIIDFMLFALAFVFLIM
jgi:hypothetical protein